jgi:para-nitrobenzyl esterase
MRAAWVSFAAHGDPGWPAYDTGRRLIQRFDTSSTVVAYPEELSRVIWQDHTFPALRLTSP